MQRLSPQLTNIQYTHAFKYVEKEKILVDALVKFAWLQNYQPDNNES